MRSTTILLTVFDAKHFAAYWAMVLLKALPISLVLGTLMVVYYLRVHGLQGRAVSTFVVKLKLTEIWISAYVLSVGLYLSLKAISK